MSVQEQKEVRLHQHSSFCKLVQGCSSARPKQASGDDDKFRNHREVHHKGNILCFQYTCTELIRDLFKAPLCKRETASGFIKNCYCHTTSNAENKTAEEQQYFSHALMNIQKI